MDFVVGLALLVIAVCVGALIDRVVIRKRMNENALRVMGRNRV